MSRKAEVQTILQRNTETLCKVSLPKLKCRRNQRNSRKQIGVFKVLGETSDRHKSSLNMGKKDLINSESTRI